MQNNPNVVYHNNCNMPIYYIFFHLKLKGRSLVQTSTFCFVLINKKTKKITESVNELIEEYFRILLNVNKCIS